MHDQWLPWPNISFVVKPQPQPTHDKFEAFQTQTLQLICSSSKEMCACIVITSAMSLFQLCQSSGGSSSNCRRTVAICHIHVLCCTDAVGYLLSLHQTWNQFFANCAQLLSSLHTANIQIYIKGHGIGIITQACEICICVSCTQFNYKHVRRIWFYLYG